MSALVGPKIRKPSSPSTAASVMSHGFARSWAEQGLELQVGEPKVSDSAGTARRRTKGSAGYCNAAGLRR
jgi:hypothetical protein